MSSTLNGLKVALCCSGTRGDHQPFISLAIYLQKLNIEVTFYGQKQFRNLCHEHGIKTFRTVEPEEDSNQPDLMEEMVKNSQDAFEVEKFLQGNHFQESMRHVFLLCSKLVQEDFDLIIGNGAYSTSLFLFAERENLKRLEQHQPGSKPPKLIKVIEVFFQPFFPTKAFPSSVSGDVPFPDPETDFYNHTLEKERELWAQIGPLMQAMGSEFGLDYGIQGSSNLLTRQRAARANLNSVLREKQLHDLEDKLHRLMLAYSPSVLPHPEDFPPESRTIGYFLSHHPSYTPHSRLLEFLARPPRRPHPQELSEQEEELRRKPFYIGFGSMIHSDPKKLTLDFVNVFERHGHKAILCEGFGSLRKPEDWDENEHPNILFEKSVSHEFLLPKCRAAFIHGGAGTTAACLSAGLPTQIYPFLADQPFWGRVVSNLLAVGPEHVYLSKVDEEVIQRSLEKLLENEETYRTNARRVAEKIAAEDPYAEVLKSIEELI